MQESSSADFLHLGTYSLHPVHTGFKSGLKELNISFDSFFHDLSFFFHFSSAPREDLRSMENVIDILAHFMKKHGPTRWLFMKLVGVGVLEQLLNLKKYILKFLTRPFLNGFKSSPRYDRVVEHLASPLTEPYIAFMVFVSQDFDKFLRVFQYDQPMIHMVWPKMIDRTSSRFVSKRQLLSEGAPKKSEEIMDIDVCNKSNCKKPSLVDVCTRAKRSLLVLFRQTARK